MVTKHVFSADIEVLRQNDKTILDFVDSRKGKTRYIVFLTQEQVSAIANPMGRTQAVPARGK